MPKFYYQTTMWYLYLYKEDIEIKRLKQREIIFFNGIDSTFGAASASAEKERAQDSVLIRKFVRRIKDSKRKIVNG